MWLIEWWVGLDWRIRFAILLVLFAIPTVLLIYDIL